MFEKGIERDTKRCLDLWFETHSILYEITFMPTRLHKEAVAILDNSVKALGKDGYNIERPKGKMISMPKI